MSARLPSPRKAILALATVACSLALTACDRSHECMTYVDMSVQGGDLCLGHMNYQVQLSRQLNPYSPEDRNYLVGLPASDAQLQPGQAWFAVFMQVTNFSGKLLSAATPQDFYVEDTTGIVYKPIVLPDHVNPYFYNGGVLGGSGDAHGGIIPALDSPATYGPADGALLLFKIQITSYDNRPLTLYIRDPLNPNKFDRADLDV
ncbi:MAG TPA: hypothetical protein VHX88_11410 [Solirubrobacteraceae bacterium]|jgi:hypothetical protein|nr:hypothetical protein [Solirubrobacteraceae bacterium]